MFLIELKCNLQSGEFVVLCDLAENYCFVLQDEAQGIHWNNAPATIHPFVIYFNKSDALNTENENLVMMSDCLKHDSIFAHTLQRHLMKFIENTFESPPKKNRLLPCWVCSPTQKQKKILNITCNNNDFGVPAESLFVVTSHGKSACDGVGGILKRLQRKSVFSGQIMIPHQGYEWAQSSIHNLSFSFVTENDYKE
jgi:hypothetical protein